MGLLRLQGVEHAVIERNQGPDGAMSLTFTRQQPQVVPRVCH